MEPLIPPTRPSPVPLNSKSSSEESLETVSSIFSGELEIDDATERAQYESITHHDDDPRGAMMDYAFPSSKPRSAPGSRKSSFGEADDPTRPFDATLTKQEVDKSLKSLREGTAEEFTGPTLRHNSLPTLTQLPSAMSRPLGDTLTDPRHASTPSLSDPTAFTNPRASPTPPSKAPVVARSHSYGALSSPSSASTRSPSLPPPSSFHPPPCLNSSSRPGSSRTYSTGSTDASTSTRPWVRDSDASSICSAGSGSCWSGGAEEGADGDVLKVGADGIEFLDPRPEPPGAKMSINRDSPTQVVLKVVLPGFSLENITVAMRRGHKVHIVADSYGENGGHFEKLVSLGSDVISAAPRAEFNGTELSVFVQRRKSSTSVPPVSLSVVTSTSPPLLSGSPSSSTSLSPNLSSDETTDSPIFTRSTENSLLHRSAKMMTGPEGAKAAAKLAREEATSRAKEAAKSLPTAIRKVPFAEEKKRRSAELSRSSPPNLMAHPAMDSATSISGLPSVAPLSIPIPPNSPQRSPTRDPTNGTNPLFNDAAPTPSSPRPKLRGSNLTLRPSSSTFFEAAMTAAKSSPTDATTGDACVRSNGEGEATSLGGEGGITPKYELGEMSFERNVLGERKSSLTREKTVRIGTAL